MYAVLNGRLRAAVPSLYPMTTTRSKSNSRAPQPMPDGSFLSRAKMRLHNRRIRVGSANWLRLLFAETVVLRIVIQKYLQNTPPLDGAV